MNNKHMWCVCDNVMCANYVLQIIKHTYMYKCCYMQHIYLNVKEVDQN